MTLPVTCANCSTTLRVESLTLSVVEQFAQVTGNVIERTSYSRDDGLITVEQYLVDRGGHEWFDLEIEGRNLNQLAWRFLSRLRKEDEGIVMDRKKSLVVQLPDTFKRGFIDDVTPFNPLTDNLEINFDGFGIDSSNSFAAGKNTKAVRKKLAKQDFDFLYDQKKGGLYFN